MPGLIYESLVLTVGNLVLINPERGHGSRALGVGRLAGSAGSESERVASYEDHPLRHVGRLTQIEVHAFHARRLAQNDRVLTVGAVFCDDQDAKIAELRLLAIDGRRTKLRLGDDETSERIQRKQRRRRFRRTRGGIQGRKKVVPGLSGPELSIRQEAARKLEIT